MYNQHLRTPDFIYREVNLRLFFLYRFNRTAWSPCDNVAVSTIMNNVAAEFNFEKDNCFSNSQTLETALWDNMEAVTLAGIQFSDSLAGRTDLDDNLEVTIR